MSETKTADSYPYVTGMGFRNRSHMVVDEFRQDPPHTISERGQVVFVKTDLTPQFMQYILPSIAHPITLITHNSALGINSDYVQFLDNPKILNWYAQNANIFHPKLRSIPLGIANQHWPHGNITEIENVRHKNLAREHLVYMNFDISTNSTKRSSVYEMFRGKEYVKHAHRKPFSEYLHDLATSKYSLSPPGAGIDCHRIWESIAVETIPIVEACHNITFYKDMPILIVDEWETITEEFLNQKYEEILSKSNRSLMFLDSWIEKVGLLPLRFPTA